MIKLKVYYPLVLDISASMEREDDLLATKTNECKVISKVTEHRITGNREG